MLVREAVTKSTSRTGRSIGNGELSNWETHVGLAWRYLRATTQTRQLLSSHFVKRFNHLIKIKKVLEWSTLFFYMFYLFCHLYFIFNFISRSNFNPFNVPTSFGGKWVAQWLAIIFKCAKECNTIRRVRNLKKKTILFPCTHGCHIFKIGTDISNFLNNVFKSSQAIKCLSTYYNIFSRRLLLSYFFEILRKWNIFWCCRNKISLFSPWQDKLQCYPLSKYLSRLK